MSKTVEKLNTTKNKKNRLYKLTDALLKIAILEMSKDGFPTIDALAKRLNVNRKTVERHLDNFHLDELCKVARPLTPAVLEAIYKQARAGKVPAQRLWLEAVEKFKVGVEVLNSGEIKTEITIKFE